MEHIFSNIEIYIPTANASNTEGVINESFFEEQINFNNFRFLINTDGTLWEDGNRYLLWKIKENENIHAETITAHSFALQKYKEFCEREDLDYRIARRMSKRPNWAYHTFLQKCVNSRELSSSTAKERMRPVTAFYRWLMDIENISFSVNLFKINQLMIHTNNKEGIGFSKLVEAVDINKFKQSHNNYDKCITDEGDKLQPLTLDQQNILYKVLKKLDNHEMNLIFTIALETGARKQTILTMRLKHFISTLPKDYSDITIDNWLKEQEQRNSNEDYTLSIGPGTGIDTKGNRRFALEVPGWLWIAIRIYIVSDQAHRRRNKTLSQNNDLDQYIFISSQSRPYYMASDDINKIVYDGQALPKGGAINSFMSATLKPEIRSKGYCFSFKFHDTRATFAMNFIELYWPLVEKKVITESELLNELRKRLGHIDRSTTKKYLDYRDMYEVLAELQDLRESRFMGLVI